MRSQGFRLWTPLRGLRIRSLSRRTVHCRALHPLRAGTSYRRCLRHCAHRAHASLRRLKDPAYAPPLPVRGKHHPDRQNKTQQYAKQRILLGVFCYCISLLPASRITIPAAAISAPFSAGFSSKVTADPQKYPGKPYSCAFPLRCRRWRTPHGGTGRGTQPAHPGRQRPPLRGCS